MNVFKLKITNPSHLHWLKLSGSDATRDAATGYATGEWSDPEPLAVLMPTQSIELPISEFRRFTLSAKAIDDPIAAPVRVGIVNSGQGTMQVRYSDRAKGKTTWTPAAIEHIATGQTGEVAISESRRAEISAS